MPNPSDDKDPESLYSGINPGTFGNEEQTEGVKEEKRKQKEQTAELIPLAADIHAFLEEEKRAIGDVRSYLKDQKSTGEEILAEFRAREIYIGYLTRFETWMNNRLQKKQQNNLPRN